MSAAVVVAAGVIWLSGCTVHGCTVARPVPRPADVRKPTPTAGPRPIYKPSVS